MRKIVNNEIIVCDRCGKVFTGWEDHISQGEVNINHSSVIDSVFTEDVNAQDKSEYFRKHKAVKFGKHPYQSMILLYGGDNEYHLCWHCNRDFIKLLGTFFQKQ